MKSQNVRTEVLITAVDQSNIAGDVVHQTHPTVNNSGTLETEGAQNDD